MSDPISDFLTVIRNAYRAGKDTCDTRFSKLHLSIASILKDEGFIRDVEKIEDGHKASLRLTLKYVDEVPALTGIKRVSRPGLRVYKAKDELPKVLGGMGVAIISTSRGVMTDREARAAGHGGEVLCIVS